MSKIIKLAAPALILPDRGIRRAMVEQRCQQQQGHFVFGFQGGGSGIPRPAGTSLLMHFDGANASTSLIDETGKAVTVQGDTQLTTSGQKVGSACATVDGTGDYVTVPLTSDLQFGTGDFTIALWMKSVGTAAAALVSNQGVVANGSGNYALQFRSSDIRLYEGTAIRLTSAVTVNDGNWRHIAVTRAGGTLRLFVDGFQSGSSFASSYDYVTGGSFGLYVGQTAGGNSFAGQLDELIAVKGTALWTADFTPPILAYA